MVYVPTRKPFASVLDIPLNSREIKVSLEPRGLSVWGTARPNEDLPCGRHNHSQDRAIKPKKEGSKSNKDTKALASV
jgi:hypothetical protein